MVKHWKLSHPELQELPKFHIKVVASFQDAMSRQLSEAVRIDLRGEHVLNSKSEYSRCKVPRLMINKEEWTENDGLKTKKDAPVNTEKVEKDILEIENALMEGGAAWDIGTKGAVKKRRQQRLRSDPRKGRWRNWWVVASSRTWI